MRIPLPLVAGALAAGLAGCGAGGGGPASTDLAALTEHRAGVDTTRSDAHPTISGPRLLEIRRTGDQFGTSDDVVYGRDGSVVVIRAYGGGGYYALRCRLSDDELAAVARDARRLPLGPAPHVPERPRKTFYTLPAPSYLVEHGHDVESFTVDAVPAGGRPMIRHLVDLLRGREGRCRKTYATRT
ncbi:MAG TPA: hypothetical protein VFT50_18545 [Baekduia sp.]|nr:hypothetical protein [Baekduia sp.]